MIFGLYIALLAAACTSRAEETPAAAQAIPVALAPIVFTQEAPAIHSSEQIGSKEEMRLSFKVGGIITAVYVQEGSRVQQGQVLARLDPVEIDAQVRQAQAAADKARRDLERIERLYADTVATLEQVQDLRTALSVAESQLEIATFNQQQAVIKAPAGGRVLKRFAERGELISPGAPVYFLAADNSSQVLRMSVSDVEVVDIRPGDRAELRFAPYPGEVFGAQVSEIAAAADPRTGAFEVELSLAPSPLTLKNGFVGQVTLFPAGRETRARIPMGAVVEAGSDWLRIYVPDSAHARLLRLGGYELGDSFLSVPAASLTGYTHVIEAGAKYLSPGSPIQVIDHASQAHR
ncbi:MAG: efflux RND transporter periplasmic adaptor subunit [Bacteroidia bacterium]